MDGLDHADVLARDTLGLVRGLAETPGAIVAARAAAEAVELPYPAEAVHDVAICGMGGSAIAGDLVLGAFGERLRRPVAVVRDYRLPGWVGESTLVILSSYSGETEETLTCAMEATDRGALCVSITSGGKLGSHYVEMGVPCVTLPGGLQPRAALPWLLVPALVVLERAGVVPAVAADLDEARDVAAAAASALGPAVPEADNPAKQIARFLHGHLPLIWGAELTAPVALRWKTQLNENAQVPAFWGALPEVDHNEIVGFAGMGALERLTRIVMLRDPRNHRQVERRFTYTRELVEPTAHGVIEVVAEGRGGLGRALDLVMLGDYASLYLALLRDVDPGPVELITRLKEKLASTGHGRAVAPE